MLITIVNEDAYFHSKGLMKTTLVCTEPFKVYFTYFLCHILSSCKEAAFTKKMHCDYIICVYLNTIYLCVWNPTYKRIWIPIYDQSVDIYTFNKDIS